MQIEHFIDRRYTVDLFSVELVAILINGHRFFCNINRKDLFSIDVDNLAPATAMIPMHAHLEIFKLAYDVFFEIEGYCTAAPWRQPQHEQTNVSF